MRKEEKVIVLGAGLSGLSAAYHGGFEVYEQRQGPGGTAGSVYKNNFVFDFGIHVIHSKNDYFLNLMKEISVEFISHNRQAQIYSFDSFSSYPFQVNTSHLPLVLRIRCVMDYLLCGRNHSAQNYEEWMIKNFGHSFARTFLIPYAEKFWGISPSEMTWDWTGNERVPRPRIWDVIKGAIRDQHSSLGPNPVFKYPRESGKGFAAISSALAERVREMFYGMRACCIVPDKKEVKFNKGDKTAQYDYLIASLPLPDIIDLIPNPPADIKKAAAQLLFNSIAIINLGVDRHGLSSKHWIHFPERDISFFRISFPANFGDNLCPPGTSSIQAEVVYDVNYPPAESNLLEIVVNDLIKVGVLKQDDSLCFKDVLYLKYGYVIYDKRRLSAVKKIHEYLHSFDIYPCGRYGSWEYQWADEAILDGKTIAERILSIKAL